MIGRTLKHYVIEEVLGNGGMGVVYRARDTRLERPVALKLLKPELIADPDRKARFLLEARAAAAVAVKDDRVTVVIGKAPAKTYIRITSLIDSTNRRLFFGKGVTGEIRDDVPDKELWTLLRQPGVTYVRDDVTLD